MFHKVEVFPVRAESAFRTENRSTGTCKYTVDIYTKFKSESCLDYTKRVQYLTTRQLLLEKHTNSKKNQTTTTTRKPKLLKNHLTLPTA